MDAETQIVSDAVSKLGEHFETVRIFVTKHNGESSKTLNLTEGLGNIYAQLGQVGEWKALQDQLGREEAKEKK